MPSHLDCQKSRSYGHDCSLLEFHAEACTLIFITIFCKVTEQKTGFLCCMQLSANICMQLSANIIFRCTPLPLFLQLTLFQEVVKDHAAHIHGVTRRGVVHGLILGVGLVV